MVQGQQSSVYSLSPVLVVQHKLYFARLEDLDVDIACSVDKAFYLIGEIKEQKTFGIHGLLST